MQILVWKSRRGPPGDKSTSPCRGLNMSWTIRGRQIFFRGGGGVKFDDPIFNGQFFSKKNNSKTFFQKNKKIKKLCFFEKK
jgi:hypothetical protein